MCTDSEVFKVCSNGVNSISNAICRQANAVCCIDQNFHGFGRCNHECSADAITAWKSRISTQIVAPVPLTTFTPCSGATCSDSTVFRTCTDGSRSVPCETISSAMCCIENDFATLGSCNRECSSDAITSFVAERSTAAPAVTTATLHPVTVDPAKKPTTYNDFAPCTGNVCNNPDVFKVCSNGVNSISNAICQQADAKCCIDQDFHGLGRCNRECNADTIAQWQAIHLLGSASAVVDYEPCAGATCQASDVFIVCSNGVNSISNGICKQATAKCCIDQDFHGFGRCNRECNADTIAEWRQSRRLASSSDTFLSLSVSGETTNGDGKSTPSSGSGSSSTSAIIGGVIGGLVLVSMIALVAMRHSGRRPNLADQSDNPYNLLEAGDAEL